MNLIFLIKYKLGLYPKITNNYNIISDLFWFSILSKSLDKMSRLIDINVKNYLKDELNSYFNLLYNGLTLILK